eukprot:9052068-Alexandrium_andersonii.AAC.1
MPLAPASQTSDVRVELCLDVGLHLQLAAYSAPFFGRKLTNASHECASLFPRGLPQRAKNAR